MHVFVGAAQHNPVAFVDGTQEASLTASTKGRLLTIRIGLIHAEIAARKGLR